MVENNSAWVFLSTNDYSVKSTLGCLESRVISLGVGMSKLRSGAGVTFFVVFEIKELLLNTSKPTLSFTLLLKFHPLLSMIASYAFFRSASIWAVFDMTDSVHEEECNYL